MRCRRRRRSTVISRVARGCEERTLWGHYEEYIIVIGLPQFFYMISTTRVIENYEKIKFHLGKILSFKEEFMAQTQFTICYFSSFPISSCLLILMNYAPHWMIVTQSKVKTTPGSVFGCGAWVGDETKCLTTL